MPEIHVGKDPGSAGNMFLIMAIIAIACLGEFLAGFFSKSMTLMLDSLHMLTDILAAALCWGAYSISKYGSDLLRSYGYERIKIIAPLVNGILLLELNIAALVGIARRFFYSNSSVVEPNIMLAGASIGLIANLSIIAITMYRLKKENTKMDLNTKGVFSHVLFDFSASAVTIISGLLIKIGVTQKIDILGSVTLVCFMTYLSYNLIRPSLHVLLEGTPEMLDLEKLKSRVVTINGIKEVHHIHAWSLAEDYVLMTAHIVLDAGVVSNKFDDVINTVKEMLRTEFNINHVTLEAEYVKCSDKVF